MVHQHLQHQSSLQLANSCCQVLTEASVSYFQTSMPDSGQCLIGMLQLHPNHTVAAYILQQLCSPHDVGLLSRGKTLRGGRFRLLQGAQCHLSCTAWMQAQVRMAMGKHQTARAQIKAENGTL